MSQLSNYLQEALLNHLLRNTNLVRPANVYVALFTVAPTDAAGSGTEVAAASYARQVMATGAGSAWDAPVIEAGGNGYECLNTGDITFPVAMEAWGNVRAFAIFDALAGGNMWWHGLLVAPVDVVVNMIFTFQAVNLHLILR